MTTLLDQGARINFPEVLIPLVIHAFEHESILKLLIDRGAAIQSSAKGTASPPFHAATRKDPGVARILIANGVVVDGVVRDVGGLTPLGTASMMGNVKVARVCSMPELSQTVFILVTPRRSCLRL